MLILKHFAHFDESHDKSPVKVLAQAVPAAAAGVPVASEEVVSKEELELAKSAIKKSLPKLELIKAHLLTCELMSPKTLRLLVEALNTEQLVLEGINLSILYKRRAPEPQIIELLWSLKHVEIDYDVDMDC